MDLMIPVADVIALPPDISYSSCQNKIATEILLFDNTEDVYCGFTRLTKKINGEYCRHHEITMDTDAILPEICRSGPAYTLTPELFHAIDMSAYPLLKPLTVTLSVVDYLEKLNLKR